MVEAVESRNQELPIQSVLQRSPASRSSPQGSHKRGASQLLVCCGGDTLLQGPFVSALSPSPVSPPLEPCLSSQRSNRAGSTPLRSVACWL